MQCSRFVPHICAALTVVIFLNQGELAQGEVRLALDGKTECSIVLPVDALELESLAAKELADHLEKVIGQRPQVVDTPESGTNVFVGRSPAIEQLVADVNFDELGTDGIVMRTVGKDLVLTGGRPRGVLFAAYSFLQDVVGVRWWAPDATHIPGKPTLVVSDLEVVYRAPFDLRHFRTMPMKDKAFALRLRHNGSLMNFDTAEHTIRRLVPPEEHFIDHPEWYMYTPEGEDGSGRYSYRDSLRQLKESDRPEAWYRVAKARRRLPSQICPSSPGVLDATMQMVLHKLKEEYANWHYLPKVVWVSQNDGRHECRCDACVAMSRREGASSAVWVQFVNAIAERVEQDYPDVLIATMAFAHTEDPPKNLRARDNVLIYSIPVSSNRKLPLTEVVNGLGVVQWCDRARHVYIWEHETNFRNWVQPHPNHFVLPQNLGFFAEQGVTGMMIQGGYGNASDFQRMRAYVGCQLMWNPHQDTRALMVEFLRGYYGDAGEFLMRWLLVQHQAVRRHRNIVLGAYDMTTTKWLTLEDLNEGTRLFDRALQAVSGAQALDYRVRRAKLGIDIVWLERYDELRAAA
ncbi:MAG: hypothetical protein CMJ20_06235, partial [Phycisphaeraceae bacterium]|nr:hypothetical protein [Phycisphaeraceae bacterium]